jgi:LPS sulfotransferase NodH
MEGLGRPRGQSDLITLELAFGPVIFVHLQREDIVGQAVSWYRAEQTGFWQQGDAASRPPERDLDQMKQLIRTIRDHNAAWRSWFDRVGVRPHAVNYEQLVHDRRTTVEGIAALLGVEVPAQWQPASAHERQADEINAEWVAALEAVLED